MKSDEGMNMPMIRNMSRATIVLEHLKGGPIVLEPSKTSEVPAEALSLPLVRHYLQAKRLELIAHKPGMTSVILSR